MNDRAYLTEGLQRLGLALSTEVEVALLNYLQLMAKWNRVYNLTSRRESGSLVPRHLLDSLSVLPYLGGGSVIDVGSGAGLPGIPLALAAPQQHFTLLDSSGKRTRFMTQAVIELGLKNVTVVKSRAETYRPETPFDRVISRAFATISDMLAVTHQLCHSEGQFLAMKGVHPESELAAMPSEYCAEAVYLLEVPFIEGQRHLAVVRRVSD